MFETLEILLDLNYHALASKFTSVMNTIHTELSKIESKKIDLDKVIKAPSKKMKASDIISTSSSDIGKVATSGFTSLNWSPIISKLFSPANLIAFFGALGAFGVIAAIQAQTAGAAAAGKVGATPAQQKQISTGALNIVAQVGDSVGSVQDVANAIGEMFNLVGNIPDAEKIILELGKALRTTGGTFSEIIMPLKQFLGAADITDLKGIQTTIANLFSAAQESGQSMLTIVDSMQELAKQAGIAGISVGAVNESIIAFGAIARENLEGAQGWIDQVATNMWDVEAAVRTSGVSSKEFIRILNDPSEGPAAILDRMLDKAKSFSKSMDSGILQQAGFNAKLVAGLVTYGDHQTAIDTLIDNTADWGEGVDNVNKKFKETETILTVISRLIAAIKAGLVTGDFFSTLMSLVAAPANMVGDIGANIEKAWEAIFGSPLGKSAGEEVGSQSDIASRSIREQLDKSSLGFNDKQIGEIIKQASSNDDLVKLSHALISGMTSSSPSFHNEFSITAPQGGEQLTGESIAKQLYQQFQGFKGK